ncbi:MAG: DegT/DnrJ/EryC1/StrS aminotransferase family protein [Ornithinimicrobium sp.]
MSHEFLPFAKPDIGEPEIEAVTNTLRSGWLTTGQNAMAFEAEFAEHVGGGRSALAVNSATAGLHLALEALGVGPGDEVIVPVWTFTATAEVVRYLGAVPVLVDVDSVTLNMNPAAVEQSITSRTKVIMPVHFAGLAVEIDAIWRLAARAGIAVVEDAAHAIPCTSKGVTIGAGHSDAVVFSFYATKPLTTGEGGMVVASDDNLLDRIRTMRLHGINRDVFDRFTRRDASWFYEVVAPGFKYNLPDTAAAMGRVQLSRAVAMGERRGEIARQYDEAFTDLRVQRPAPAPQGDVHSWHLYVLRLETGRLRDDFIGQMSAAGVGTSVHYTPLHLHPYWRDFCGVGPTDFPTATAEFDRVVSLPIFSSMKDQEVGRVVETVRSILA